MFLKLNYATIQMLITVSHKTAHKQGHSSVKCAPQINCIDPNQKIKQTFLNLILLTSSITNVNTPTNHGNQNDVFCTLLT